jgi:UDP-2,3-diacylglucosamine pyrophosphatase LpxH
MAFAFQPEFRLRLPLMFQIGYSRAKKWEQMLIAVASESSPDAKFNRHQAMKDEQPHLDLDLSKPLVCRSVWISDIHLGTRHARVTELLEFLRVVECKYLYIVGDFIDGWELKFRWFWRDDYNVLIQKILRKSRKQTKVIYITGNHDEFVDQFAGMRFGSVVMAHQVIHTAADGKKYLVIHGHQADGLTHFNHLLEKLGSHIYNWILDFNLHFNRLRRALGFGYWSLAAYLKFKAKSAVKYVTEYEETLAQMARNQQTDGVICGHIHRAEMKMLGDVQYLNCGDWVESCTALVEDFDGKIKLIHFHENDVLRAGRRPGSPDSGDGRQGNAGGGGTSNRRRDPRRQRATADAGILRIGDETARPTIADARVQI